MTIKEQRKRRFLQDPPPKSLPSTKESNSKKLTSVFFLYDRESVRDRELIQRLLITLENDKLVKCSILDGKPGWVLKSYEDELEAADKVVVLFSADFLSSEEASFVFEMTRSLCMDRRENKIIIASKSGRNLPKAYDGFPRVKMTTKFWIKDLIKKVKKPAIQASTNTWTFNKAGYKTVNIQELYKECENKTSTSMPTLECLERPPTLPKSVADKIMGLSRAESQRAKKTFDFENFTKIRKASSFSKDRETMEFISRSCMRSRRNRRSRNFSSSSRPASGVYASAPLVSPPNSPQWSETRIQNQQYYAWQSPPPTPSSPTGNHRDERECDNLKTRRTQHITQSGQEQVHDLIDHCCKKRFCDAMTPSEGNCIVTDNLHRRRLSTGYSNTEYSPTDSRLAVIITTFIEAMHTAGQTVPDNHAIDLQSSHLALDCGSSSTTPAPVTSVTEHSVPASNRDQTLSQTELLDKFIPVQQAMIQAPEHVTKYVNLPEDPLLRRLQSVSVSNLETEFDNALCERPKDFRSVNFDHEDGDFVVQRGETVWLQTFQRSKTVSVRKRNGLMGHIPRILLSSYIDRVVLNEQTAS